MAAANVTSGEKSKKAGNIYTGGDTRPHLIGFNVAKSRRVSQQILPTVWPGTRKCLGVTCAATER